MIRDFDESVNLTLPALLSFVLLHSICGQSKPDLDDPVVLKEILSSAVTSLEEREMPDGVCLLFEPKQDRPFSGWRKQCRQSGQVRVLQKYKDGKAHGPYLYWWENGRKAEQKNQREGRAHGACRSWYENGQKQLQQTVRFGKIEGSACRWYKNGGKKDESIYEGGKILSVKVWKPNGQSCPVTKLENGNGLWVRYKEDGTEAWRAQYRDGKYVLK